MNAVQPPARTPSPTTYTVLFTAPQDSLPEPLPTPEEIEDSANIVKQRHSRCIARVGRSYVVKFGSQVDPLEGENMEFVRQHAPDAPVPRVYAIYQREVTPRTSITYIVMEDVQGSPLDGVWGSLNQQSKTEVAINVHDALDSLRAIQHLGYFGSINMSKPRDDFFWTDEPIRPDHGTFNTEADFNLGVINKYLNCSHGSAPQKVQFYRQILPTALRGTNEPVFTHNALEPSNILVRPGGSIVITGWASAGWYPSYWEYTKAIHLCTWTDDWHYYVNTVVQEHPNQLAWMSMLRNELASQRSIM